MKHRGVLCVTLLVLLQSSSSHDDELFADSFEKAPLLWGYYFVAIEYAGNDVLQNVQDTAATTNMLSVRPIDPGFNLDGFIRLGSDNGNKVMVNINKYTQWNPQHIEQARQHIVAFEGIDEIDARAITVSQAQAIYVDVKQRYPGIPIFCNFSAGAILPMFNIPREFRAEEIPEACDWIGYTPSYGTDDIGPLEDLLQVAETLDKKILFLLDAYSREEFDERGGGSNEVRIEKMKRTVNLLKDHPRVVGFYTFYYGSAPLPDNEPGSGIALNPDLQHTLNTLFNQVQQ